VTIIGNFNCNFICKYQHHYRPKGIGDTKISVPRYFQWVSSTAG